MSVIWILLMLHAAVITAGMGCFAFWKLGAVVAARTWYLFTRITAGLFWLLAGVGLDVACVVLVCVAVPAMFGLDPFMGVIFA